MGNVADNIAGGIVAGMATGGGEACTQLGRGAGACGGAARLARLAQNGVRNVERAAEWKGHIQTAVSVGDALKFAYPTAVVGAAFSAAPQLSRNLTKRNEFTPAPAAAPTALSPAHQF